MNVSPSAPLHPPSPAPDIQVQARKACLRVPPLWPLHSFVAVNPFVGLSDRPFADACSLFPRVCGQSMLMDPGYFARQHADGRITLSDLASAVRQMMPGLDEPQVTQEVKRLVHLVNHPEEEKTPQIAAFCDLAQQRSGVPWRSAVVQEAAKWCAAYFDAGQSSWRMPWQHLPFYQAWKKAAETDATPEILGLSGFRNYVAALPVSSEEALKSLTAELELAGEDVEDYFHHLLLMMPGWSGYMQKKPCEKDGQEDGPRNLSDLLTVLLAFEGALARQHGQEVKLAFRQRLRSSRTGNTSASGQGLLIWQRAMEAGFQKRLCAGLLQPERAAAREGGGRPALQAVFCIDVRSEVMRRCLESLSPEVQTLGFAGFFGMPVEHVPLGRRSGTSQVPVLLAPRYRVREGLPHTTPEQARSRLRQMRASRRVRHAWSAFKSSAVSGFSFVESAGIGFAWQLLRNAFPLHLGHSHRKHACTAPQIHDSHECSHGSDAALPSDGGIPAADQISLALGALRNMGLTSNFAPLVILCGHGSSTTNNPYAAGLDCGACGGHAGGVNAQVAAAILNQPAVRTGLCKHGIHIPDDVHFLAAEHDTTTDRIVLFNRTDAPAGHQASILQAECWLAEAGELCRGQRAAGLGLGGVKGQELENLICLRSRDWSQVRPEWGLAGNAALVAAPRERTRHLNLEGRVFLHNYCAGADPHKTTLELIMTAPMVVAHWINMQYYASTVNNAMWGSGDKVLHNVTGTVGILQGNGGDLQTGLPLQSVHDGVDWVHEPLRLSVIIEAARDDISAVLNKHPEICQLVDNQWLHLFALENEGLAIYQRSSTGEWLRVENAG